MAAKYKALVSLVIQQGRAYGGWDHIICENGFLQSHEQEFRHHVDRVLLLRRALGRMVQDGILKILPNQGSYILDRNSSLNGFEDENTSLLKSHHGIWQISTSKEVTPTMSEHFKRLVCFISDKDKADKDEATINLDEANSRTGNHATAETNVPMPRDRKRKAPIHSLGDGLLWPAPKKVKIVEPMYIEADNELKNSIQLGERHPSLPDTLYLDLARLRELYPDDRFGAQVRDDGQGQHSLLQIVCHDCGDYQEVIPHDTKLNPAFQQHCESQRHVCAVLARLESEGAELIATPAAMRRIQMIDRTTKHGRRDLGKDPYLTSYFAYKAQLKAPSQHNPLVQDATIPHIEWYGLDLLGVSRKEELDAQGLNLLQFYTSIHMSVQTHVNKVIKPMEIELTTRKKNEDKLTSEVDGLKLRMDSLVEQTKSMRARIKAVEAGVARERKTYTESALDEFTVEGDLQYPDLTA